MYPPRQPQHIRAALRRRIYSGPRTAPLLSVRILHPSHQRIPPQRNLPYFPQHYQMPTITDEDKTIEAATELLESMRKEIPAAAREKKQWLKIIRKLQAALSHGEPRVATQGQVRVATQGQARVDGASTTPRSPTCPRTLQTKPRIHQRKTRRNMPETEHTAMEPAHHGEGLRQTQIYMRSDKVEETA